MVVIRNAFLAAMVLTVFVGCEAKPPESKDVPPVAPGNAPETPPAKPEESKAAPGAAEGTSPKAADVKLGDEEMANIKKLSEEDQKLALAQKVCPITGEPLGSMGTPLKTSAEGTPLLVCCKGCLADVKEHPKDALAKLNQK